MAHQSQTKKIGVLGCGWLGLPLSISFISKGYLVKGSTTSPDKLNVLRGVAIQPFLIDLEKDKIEEIFQTFFDVDVLLICIPPGKKSPENQYYLHISKIIDFVPVNCKVIFISSTSVYHSENKIVVESDINNWLESAHPKIAKVEDLIKSSFKRYVILRCGGLTGYDRNLGKYFAGKTQLKEGHCPVNLIHRDDVINIIQHLVDFNVDNEVINICAPLHPLKKSFYTQLCERFNMPLPSFVENDESAFKIVSVDKLVDKLGYRFIYEDPYLFDY